MSTVIAVALRAGSYRRACSDRPRSRKYAWCSICEELSTGNFREALPALSGKEATVGLSPTAITRLAAAWQQEYDSFRKDDIRSKRFVYIRADGIHFHIRLEDERLFTLVLSGVREDGSKELIAVEDGYRERKESWLSVLQGTKEASIPGEEPAPRHLQVGDERDRERMLTFFDFPAAHWQSIRSADVIESAFATVRMRQRVTKGAGSLAKGLTMAFKLLAMAQKRWRKI
jgi:transposase-like protein